VWIEGGRAADLLKTPPSRDRKPNPPSPMELSRQNEVPLRDAEDSNGLREFEQRRLTLSGGNLSEAEKNSTVFSFVAAAGRFPPTGRHSVGVGFVFRAAGRQEKKGWKKMRAIRSRLGCGTGDVQIVAYSTT